jgi:precorrin-6B methylase 2
MTVTQFCRAKIGRTLDRINDARWERKLGIDTRGLKATDKPDSVHYVALSYRLIRRMLKQLELTAEDTFADLGCGKGRILAMAALYTDAKVVGVEYDASLCQVARRNAAHHGVDITVTCSAAEDFDYSGINVIFMHKPFGKATLEKVLDKIRADVSGPVRVIYFNCSEECLDVFQSHTWLRLTRTDWVGGVMPNVYFESNTDG